MYKGIVLFGPPGVGKGTQAKLLADQGDYFHFSSGDMFRNLDQNSKLGKRVRALIDDGNFIDDYTTMELARQTLMQHRAHGRYDNSKQYLLLDGLPRNKQQVPLINSFVDVLQVVNFYVPDEEVLVKRVINRGLQENRADDNEATFRKRLRIYHEKTEPMLQLYDPELVVGIDGSESITDVHHSILEQIIGIK
jgi:adenylate kinase